MNQIVEKVNWSEGSYWGEPGKFKFRCSIDSFEDASEHEGTQRKIKTNFSVTLKGYLIPESFNDILTTQKFITPKQIVIKDETDLNILPILDLEKGARSIRVVTNIGSEPAGGGGDSVWKVTSLNGEDAYLLDYSMQTTGEASIGGNLTTTGDINSTGTIYEDGNSVTDHGTAMSIVFGG
jgi:hypothetical protein